MELFIVKIGIKTSRYSNINTSLEVPQYATDYNSAVELVTHYYKGYEGFVVVSVSNVTPKK